VDIGNETSIKKLANPMTRSTGVKLFACPKCGQIHRQTIYGSINLNVSPDLPSRFATEIDCERCGAHWLISELLYIGREYYQPEYIVFHDDTRSFWEKVKDFFAGRKFEIMTFPDVVQPDWMNYPDITYNKTK
jgi:ribosomal protein S27E